MKKALVFVVLLVFSFVPAQNLSSIFKDKIQPTATTAQLKEGLQKIEDLCQTTPQDKCNKAQATANFLLADKYYSAAYQVALVDKELTKPIIKIANNYYNKAVSYKSLDSFDARQLTVLIKHRRNFESLNGSKKLLLEN